MKRYIEPGKCNQIFTAWFAAQVCGQIPDGSHLRLRSCRNGYRMTRSPAGDKDCEGDETVKSIRNSIVSFWRALDTLEERIYFLTLFVAGIAAVVSTVAGIIQRLPVFSIFITFAIFVFVVVLTLVSIRFPEKRASQRLCLVFAINFCFFRRFSLHPAAFTAEWACFCWWDCFSRRLCCMEN
ncbi:MAG: hypothetical protein IJT77_01130 [Clostridia bacterium]|nr:hypothetical protein [Clostridia bacterium]